jgi:MFS family permease
MFQALRIRDFRLLWAAGLVSSLGSWLLVLAVPAHVFLVTKSITATGYTLAAAYAPLLLLGPVAGALTDRWDRRRVMIASDMFRVLVVTAMLAALSPGRYWIFYLTLAAESCGTVLFTPGVRALTPAVVGTGTALNSASALNALSNGVTRLAGGPLGGILLAVCGIRFLICADAVSYLVSGVLIALVSPPRRRGTAGRVTIVTDLLDGLRYLRSEPTVRALLPVTVIFLAANGSLTAVLIPFCVQHLGGSERTGFVLAALGAGFLVGAPALKVLLDRFPGRYLLGFTLAANAGGYLGLFSSSSLGTALPAAMVIGLFGSMCLVVPQTLVQRSVPGELLGRVSAVFLTGEAAATLVGAVAGPALVRVVQVTGLAVAASSLTLVAAALSVALIPPAPRKATPVVASPRGTKHVKLGHDSVVPCDKSCSVTDVALRGCVGVGGGGRGLQRAGHGDLVEGGIGRERLALAGRGEAAVLIEAAGRGIALGNPQVRGPGANAGTPVRYRSHEGFADAVAAGLRPYPHRDQLDDAGRFLVTAGQSRGLAAADFRHICEELGAAGNPAAPVRLGEGSLLRVGRPECLRRVQQGRKPDIPQGLPVFLVNLPHENHAT